ncbi:hypothetical protein AVEN_207184-1 [Araneus ventricosus]|uniref:Uncharacterized protein n=1 Tax=Araneus ventricosus TaxID=182803 RepID=A0A4Y2HU51_ARAVE|nr:hypothetical protein AVEN_207184-1 [Araneus ventricosus]
MEGHLPKLALPAVASIILRFTSKLSSCSTTLPDAFRIQQWNSEEKFVQYPQMHPHFVLIPPIHLINEHECQNFSTVRNIWNETAQKPLLISHPATLATAQCPVERLNRTPGSLAIRIVS